jgi:hypothetical protein
MKGWSFLSIATLQWIDGFVWASALDGIQSYCSAVAYHLYFPAGVIYTIIRHCHALD